MVRATEDGINIHVECYLRIVKFVRRMEEPFKITFSERLLSSR
jgi:hypothetical protein